MKVRRHQHGSTRRPPLSHPGNGYGRPGRPGPAPSWNREAVTWRRYGSGWDPARLLELDLEELAASDGSGAPAGGSVISDGVSEAG